MGVRKTTVETYHAVAKAVCTTTFFGHSAPGELIRVHHDNGQDPRGCGPPHWVAGAPNDLGDSFVTVEEAKAFIKRTVWPTGSGWGWKDIVPDSPKIIKRTVVTETHLTEEEVE